MNKLKIEEMILLSSLLCEFCKLANEAIVLVHALNNCQPF